MLLNKKKKTLFILALVVTLGTLTLFFIQSQSSYAKDISACAKVQTSESHRIDCWYSVIRDVFDDKGTEAAFDVFIDIYETYPDFTNTGCHRHAHRIGDMAYYYDYLSHKDLSQVSFPKNASTCGYGFYHGFFEHLVQDSPDPEFVTDTCNFLTNSIFPNAPAIGQTCYHGSGHGLVLSVLESLTNADAWTVENFSKKPLAFCDSLPDANEREKSDCRQGVFNVIVDWMDDGEYNLVYDVEQPFAICERQKQEHVYDCYYEMAQKVDRLSNFDLYTMGELARKASGARLQQLILNVGAAGLVQHDPKGDMNDFLSACMSFEDGLKEACIKGILGGLVEHGVTGEYDRAVTFCDSDIMGEYEQTICNDELYKKLSRFETRDSILRMCEQQLSQAFCERIDVLSRENNLH